MLYTLHELQRSLLAPSARLASLGARAWSSVPGSVWPFASTAAASCALWERLAREYPKPSFGLSEVLVHGARSAVVERADKRLAFCELRRFSLENSRSKPAPRVLLVAPLSGHHATLLRDTVASLVVDHDVWVTDWVDARQVPASEGPFGLDDYIDYVTTFLEHLGPDVHVVSVCQPTVPVLAAVSLMASRGQSLLPRSMTLMGGPIDPRKSPTEVNRFATSRPHAWFEQNLIATVPGRYPGRGRRVYPGFVQLAGFVSMNPGKHWRSHHDYFVDVAGRRGDRARSHERFYDEYNAVLDLPAEFYLETIRTVFQECALARGAWDVRGERVRPSAIEGVGLLTIEGELDDISGAGQTHAAHELCSGIAAEHKRSMTAPGCGHYGIFSGRRWREQIAPVVAEFIRAHEARDRGGKR